jgi:hypothetical protein
MASFQQTDAIERAVRRLTARLTTLREFWDAATSAVDPCSPSNLDFCRGLCDTALRDCKAIETLVLNLSASSIDYANASLNLRLMQTLADVIATRSDEVKQALLEMLEQTVQKPDERRWPRKPAGLPATVSQASARVVDLSYGGLRLELAGSPADFTEPVDVALPTLGLSIKAVLRWAKPIEAEGTWWCGAEVAPGDSEAQQTLRGVVDSLN